MFLSFASEVISTSGSTAMLILTIENMLPIVALGQMLLSYNIKPSFRFGIMLLSLKLLKLLLLQVLVRHHDIRWKTASPTVARGYSYAAWLVTPFWPWNDIGIFNYKIVICTSGFRLPSWKLDTMWYTSMIVLLSAVNKTTFEVLHNALMVTKMH